MSSDKKEKLCKAVNKGALEDNLEQYIEIVSKPKYICLKCGRVARKKKYLHKPYKILHAE